MSLDPPIKPARRNLALHEAGHAVAAIWLGLGVSKITLASDGKRNVGCVWSTVRSVRAATVALRTGRLRPLLDFAVMVCAGLLAYPAQGADLDTIDMLASAAANDRSRFAKQAFVRLAWRRTRRLFEVAEFRLAVERIAEVLIESWPVGMTGREARRIVRRTIAAV